MYPCSVGIVSHKDLAHGGLSLSGKDYMKSSLIGGPLGRFFSLRGGPFGEDVSLLSGDCPQGRTRHRPRPPGSRPSGEAGPQFSFA